MKISVRQLRRIIRESLITEFGADTWNPDSDGPASDIDFIWDFETPEEIEHFLSVLDDPHGDYSHYDRGQKMLMRNAAEDRLESMR